MAIMGRSSAAMAARYQRVLNTIRKGVADHVGGLLWDDNEGDSATDEEPAEQRPSCQSD
jgi:integrase